MAFKIRLVLATLLFPGAGLNAWAQAAPSATGNSTQASSSIHNLSGVAAGLWRGFNADLNYSGVHNSLIGWYSAASPALSYTFSERYSADVGSAIYFDHRELHYVSHGQPAYQLVTEGENVGDTLFAIHAAFEPKACEDAVTASLSAPTGNPSAGLGTGRATFDMTNHVERYRGPLGLLLDLGAGDSSGLFNTTVSRNYSSLGALAHFLSGVDYAFGERAFIEAVAYEQLPVGSQKLYSVPSNSSSAHTQSSASGTGLAEDNGLTTYLEVPLGGLITFGGYYNRSLRRHSDTVSFGLTWVLRGKRKEEASLADRALLEAEKPNGP